MNAVDWAELQLDDLPGWFRDKISGYNLGPLALKAWVNRQIPTLDHRSLCEMLRLGGENENKVRDNLKKIEGNQMV